MNEGEGGECLGRLCSACVDVARMSLSWFRRCGRKCTSGDRECTSGDLGPIGPSRVIYDPRSTYTKHSRARGVISFIACLQSSYIISKSRAACVHTSHALASQLCAFDPTAKRTCREWTLEKVKRWCWVIASMPKQTQGGRVGSRTCSQRRIRRRGNLSVSSARPMQRPSSVDPPHSGEPRPATPNRPRPGSKVDGLYRCVGRRARN